MKLAILDHSDSSGGISRFIKGLALNLTKNHPDCNISFFVNKEVAKRDSFIQEFKGLNINIIPIKGPKGDKLEELAKVNNLNTGEKIFKSVKKKLRKFKIFITVYKKLLFLYDHLWLRRVLNKRPWYDFKLDRKIIKQLDTYDIIYLSTPIFIKPFRLKKPIICTFHDFNWKHNFLGNFNKEMLKIIEKETKLWMKIYDIVISSTRFIQKEMLFYYPYVKKKEVIYLPGFNISSNKINSKKITRKYNLPKEFILYPANISTHKNVYTLIKAFGLLRKKPSFLPLIITGLNTDKISTNLDNLEEDHALYATNKALIDSKLKQDKDIFVLGYISNEEMDFLLKKATLVVSSSIYEAGCGPALEAWKNDIPVAFSNIEPFLEQLEVLKTKAWVFDPKDPEDIASKITQALTEKEKTKEMVEISKKEIQKLTWEKVADQYYQVFEKAAEDFKR